MATEPQWRYLVPAPVREVPADLAAVTAVAALTCLAVTVPGLRETPLRTVLGVPFVLFCPGYAGTAALFPERDGPAIAGPADPSSRSVVALVRCGLSVVASIALVVVLGLALATLGGGLALVPTVLALAGVTVGAAAVAAARRRALAPRERVSFQVGDALAAARSGLFAPATRTDAALNAVLGLSLLLAVGGAGFALAAPADPMPVTELSLLGEDEDGAPTAGEYPRELVRGENASYGVGVANRSPERASYAVVVELQTVVDANGTGPTVVEETELRRFELEVAAGEETVRTVDVRPTRTGERLRLAVLLYRDGVPSDPTIENAHRETHVWVRVDEPAT